jgi:TonB family protein
MDEDLKRARSRFFGENDLPANEETLAADDRELKSLLNGWEAPELPPSAFDGQLLAAYRQHFASNEFTETIPAQAAPAGTGRREYSNEVVKMKHCPTCNEEFADKFGFCPVDGTPLTASVSAVPASAGVAAATGSEGLNVTMNRADEPSLETISPPLPPPSINNAPENDTESWSTITSSTGVADRDEYHLTMLEDIGLRRRLTVNLRNVAEESRLTWPEFKRDPAGYAKRAAIGYGAATRKFFSQENVALATLAGIFAVATVVILAVVFSRLQERNILAPNEDQLTHIMDIPLDQEEPPPPDRGVGANDQGRVGFNRGRGEGSRPEPARAGGGGGGGQNEPTPPQRGMPPAPGVIPDRIPTTPPPPTVQRLPPSGPDYDVALRPPVSNLPFGVPTGQTETRSAGPGTGEGIGTGRGTGVGQGDGRGVGPGNGRNMGGGDPRDGGGGSGGSSGGNPDPNRVYRTSEVTRRYVIISKPEAQYTEEARRNSVMGTVTLRAIFSSSGQVTNIVPVQRLPHGLTEQAIAAARRINFTPAQVNGRPVSTHVTLQYSFQIH